MTYESRNIRLRTDRQYQRKIRGIEGMLFNRTNDPGDVQFWDERESRRLYKDKHLYCIGSDIGSHAIS